MRKKNLKLEKDSKSNSEKSELSYEEPSQINLDNYYYHQRVRKVAQDLYAMSGYKSGQDLFNWIEAEKIVRGQTSLNEKKQTKSRIIDKEGEFNGLLWIKQKNGSKKERTV